MRMPPLASAVPAPHPAPVSLLRYANVQAVNQSTDVQVRIISLEAEDPSKVVGGQAVQSSPVSLLRLDSPAMGAAGTEEGRGVGALFLHIGAALHLTRSYVLLEPAPL